ncbi:MAG: hypothetical protein KJS77_03415, partial [Planctomycetes bacterium]|nr:hypothetical protein [Planctomycetota bacterium]
MLALLHRSRSKLPGGGATVYGAPHEESWIFHCPRAVAIERASTDLPLIVLLFDRRLGEARLVADARLRAA